MALMDIYFLGARLFYWLYLLIAILGMGAVILYFERRALQKKYYETRFPEELIICSIIYPQRMIRDFPQLIPKGAFFTMEGGIYLYSDECVIKNNGWFSKENPDGKYTAKLDGKEYIIDLNKKYKYRWEKWPRIFYYYGCPYPIDMTKGEITGIREKGEDKEIITQYSAKELYKFGEQKILTDVYAELQGMTPFIFVIVLLVIILLIVGYLALKVSKLS